MKNISPIGLGCVTFGREINQAESFIMMDHAWAHGITHFDTAAAYGLGASERIIGSWFASRRPEADSISIATKILPPYTPDQIETSVDTSLQRLKADVIDILYLHRWDRTCETAEALEAFNNLVDIGKIRMLGASNFSSEQLNKGLQLQAEDGLVPFRFVQNNHNLAVSGITDQFRSICAANSINIVTYSPLGAGFLTGKHQHGVYPESRFAQIPGHQDIYFTPTAYRRLERLQLIAARTGNSPVHLALAWALHQKDITSVLIGGRKPAHLDQAFDSLSFDDPAVFAALEVE